MFLLFNFWPNWQLFERELNSKKAPANCALNFNANAELVLDSKQQAQAKIDYLNLNKAEAKVSAILQFWETGWTGWS